MSGGLSDGVLDLADDGDRLSPSYADTVARALGFAFLGGMVFGAIFAVAYVGPNSGLPVVWAAVVGAVIGAEMAIVAGPLLALGGWLLTRRLRNGRTSAEHYRRNFRALGVLLAVAFPAAWSAAIISAGNTREIVVTVAATVTGFAYGAFAGARLADCELRRATPRGGSRPGAMVR